MGLRKASLMEPNKYPIYIISKGRWESRQTVKALEKIKVAFRIVVEPQEFEQYAAVIDPAKILVLPFSNLGRGSIPARNWVWEHSKAEGHLSHWILDDNIQWFARYHKNKKLHLRSGVCFTCTEDLADRYTNVALAGLQYEFFVVASVKNQPLIINSRIYSCILIRNDIPYRWRGRYNEDTDLSLRVLKDGWCTLLICSMVCKKTTTMIMKGGNTDQLYKGEGRLLMAQELQRQHPDVVTIVRKWDRWQHQVNYKPFSKNKLKLKSGMVSATASNEYGMKIIKEDKSNG